MIECFREYADTLLSELFTVYKQEVYYMEYRVYDSLVEDARAIREKVFVEEQRFEQEFDDIDDYAKVIVCYGGARPVAISRYFKDGEEWRIGRLAVIAEYRGKGLGREMITEAEKAIKREGGSFVSLDAQLRAQSFYEKCGYRPVGETFFEEYCEHIKMVKNI